MLRRKASRNKPLFSSVKTKLFTFIFFRREKEFGVMDENGDGIVTVDELTKYLDPTHEQRAINEGNYLISMADRNRDDHLSEKEMLMNYQLFTGSTMANYAGYLHDEF